MGERGHLNAVRATQIWAQGKHLDLRNKIENVFLVECDRVELHIQVFTQCHDMNDTEISCVFVAHM